MKTLLHIHPSGVITTKQQALAVVKQGQIASYELVEPPLIRIYGDDVVVAGRATPTTRASQCHDDFDMDQEGRCLALRLDSNWRGAHSGPQK